MFSLSMLTVAFYLFGIYFTDDIGLSATLFLFLGLFTLAIIKRNNRRMLFLAAFFILLGSFRYGAVCDSPLMRQFGDKYISANGVIFSLPEEKDGTYSYRYTLKMDTFSYLGTAYKTNQRVVLHTNEPFEFGDRVLVSGFLSEISGINNEFEYDFSKYYKSRGIRGYIAAREAMKTGEAFILSPEFVSGKIKNAVSQTISRHYSGNRAALLKAILINDKSGFDKEYKKSLLRSGLYRSLYSPFMHISLLFALAGIFFRERQKREYLAIVLIVLYALLSGVTPTALKACAISIIVLFKKEILGFSNKLDILSLVVLILTFFDPMLCFNSGFIASVASTVLVYFSHSPIYGKIALFFDKHRIRSPKLCWVLTTWIIFSLGSIPFCAYFNNGISVYSALFSALMIPIIGIIATVSAPVLISLRFFGYNGSATFLLNMIADFVGFLPIFAEKLPFAFLQLKTPAIREIIVFYLLWWVFLRWLSGKFRSRKTNALILSAFVLCIAGISPYSFNTLSVNFVNVGQGDGAVLHTTRGETVIIDGGGASEYNDSYNVGEQVFVPYLVSHGFSDIDVAILSHPHKDHAEGIIAAAKRLKIDTLVMPDTEPDNIYRQELEKLSAERKFKIEYLAAGDEIRFKSGLNIKFLAPDKAQLLSAGNNASLVAHISYGEFDALFTGDSSDAPDMNYPSGVDILKVAHHGSDSATGKEYVQRISPKYAVISVGEDNSYALPDKSVVDNLTESGATVLRTDECGDIRFKAKKNGKTIYKTLKGE